MDLFCENKTFQYWRRSRSTYSQNKYIFMFSNKNTPKIYSFYVEILKTKLICFHPFFQFYFAKVRAFVICNICVSVILLCENKFERWKHLCGMNTRQIILQ